MTASRGPSHLFVSPHFDDAVFSCGGRIHQLTMAGHSVLVMTMMGGLREGPLPDTPIIADLHRRWQAGENPLRERREEDKQALGRLEAEHRHLPLTDCVYRQVDGIALYPSEESLFGQIHAKDYAPDCLRTAPLPDSVSSLYLPMAVGRHVDHQIARDWGLRLMRQKPSGLSIRFYAEYPYFKSERGICEALTAIDLPMREQQMKLSEADVTAKVGAMACYRSQISTFWRDLEAMEVDLRRAMLNRRGEFVERFWMLHTQI